MDVETEKTLFTLSLLPAYGFSEKAQPIGWRRVMVTCPIFGDDVLEERVISLFRRLGQDGRGVTLTSLQTYTGVPGTRLRALLASLVQRVNLPQLSAILWLLILRSVCHYLQKTRDRHR